jgi:hypothetical protein
MSTDEVVAGITGMFPARRFDDGRLHLVDGVTAGER